MRLRQLDASFIRREVRVELRRFIKPEVFAVNKTGPYGDDDIAEQLGPVVYLPPADGIADAHGLFFFCPKCYAENHGEVGTHSVICWFVGKVPDDAEPKPGRWTPTGTGLDDLSFVPSAGRSNSVLLLSGCGWHGFVTNGDAT